MGVQHAGYLHEHVANVDCPSLIRATAGMKWGAVIQRRHQQLSRG